MGCDYYIIKALHIYYNDNDYLELELERKRAYYNYTYLDHLDEDDDDYDKHVEAYIKYTLTPEMNPIIIYNNHTFNKESSEIKYKNLVEDTINKSNKAMSEITKIVKVEVRRKRE
jgi:hypothetical protein